MNAATVADTDTTTTTDTNKLQVCVVNFEGTGMHSSSIFSEEVT
jgi:hypothetical protein